MITLEQVEKLRQYADITYDEAKAALEKAEGDLLQAVIDLERAGKIPPPPGGGAYTSAPAREIAPAKDAEGKKSRRDKEDDTAFRRNMESLWRWIRDMIHKGNTNALVVSRHGEETMRLPITLLVVLLLFAFWIVVPLLVVGLFFNFRYAFQGPDIRSTKVNDAMDNVAKAADEIKNDMRSN